MDCRIALSAAFITAPAAAQFVAFDELQFDLNSITISAMDDQEGASSFDGLTHTGLLVLSSDADSALTTYVDGSGLPALLRGGPMGAFSFDGIIELVNGEIVGGAFSIEVDGTVVSTAVMPDQGGVNNQMTVTGGAFRLDGRTENGAISDDMLGNIDVSNFGLTAYIGNFLGIDFTPNAAGVDSSADLEIFITSQVPAPAPLAISALGVSLLAVNRRR